MDAGDTFRRQYGSHLWVVVSDPAKDAEQVLIVNMTTVRRFHDPACVLNVGDHPFVKHPTYMNYRESRIVTNSELDAQLAGGQIILEDRVDESIFQRIRDGAGISDYIPLGNLQVLIDQGLVA